MRSLRPRALMPFPPARLFLLFAVAGVMSGAATIAFYWLLRFLTRWLLGPAGFFPAGIAADTGPVFHAASAFGHPWAIPLLASGGALISAALVFKVAPETEGHGTDTAIRAINTAPAGMRLRAMPVKMVASAVTIGSGGSGGSEGPIAQIASTCASVLAATERLRLSHREARVLVTAGLAAGVGAIFRAPFGGALLGVELLFRRERDWQMLIPSLIASVIAYLEFGLAFGYSPMFGHVPGFQLASAAQLLVFPVLGVCCGLLARAYTWLLYGLTHLTSRLRFPRPLRAGLGGLMAGGLGLLVPGVLGTGYGTIQLVLSPQRVLHLSLLLLIAIPFAKLVGTSLSIGSGGSGGVFGPCMVVGATAGAALWRLGETAGLHALLPASPALLAVAGMAACLGSAARAPLAITLIAVESTGPIWGNVWSDGGYWTLAAAVLSVPFAAFFMRRDTLYRSQPEDSQELEKATRDTKVIAALQDVEEPQPVGLQQFDRETEFPPGSECSQPT